MVHTLFEWRYGGHQVLLCGSFCGWTQIPMILVEGSSMIFQRMCDLPLGYHQYKFLVDGVWRLDDKQLCVQDEYGNINNLVLVKELALISPTLHAEAIQPSMDIDNSGIIQQTVSVEVIAFDVKVAVKDAFHVMHNEGVAIVPLLDEHKNISGMLTASDFILILIELHNTRGMPGNEQLETLTVSAWKRRKSQLHREAVGATLSPYGRPLIQAGSDDSLNDVALRILQNKLSTVPVLHSAGDGSCPQLLHIACLAGILKHLCRHVTHHLEDLPLLQQPICNFPLGSWTREVGRASGRLLITLHPSDSLSSALNLFIEAQISAIPIIDDNGALVNVYSRSDITSLAKGSVYAHIQLDQTIMSQALELVDEATHGRYHTCTRSDSLYRVMERLSDPVVRHLVVVEAGSQRVEGIITLRDVFNVFLT